MFEKEHLAAFERASQITGIKILAKTCEVKGHTNLNLMQRPNGETFCPRCLKEEKEIQLIDNWTAKSYRSMAQHDKSFLYRNSIVNNEKIFDSGFKNFTATNSVEKLAKSKLIEFSKRIAKGENLHVFLQGPAGTGKSHLSMAAVKTINETSPGKKCVYVNLSRFFIELKSTFNKNEPGTKTEQDFVDLLSDCDVLVIDDLGKESGDANQATVSQYTHKILYPVIDAREDKPTIITTNFSWQDLGKTYDEAFVSRINKNIELVTFLGIKDKRRS